jgi:hypothetical protein
MTYTYIRRLKEVEDLIIDLEDRMSEWEPDQAEYDKYLDMLYGDVFIAGAVYSTSYLVKEIDPMKYEIGYSEWVDNLDKSDYFEYKEMEDDRNDLLNERFDLEQLEEKLEKFDE